ncbi:MAG: hypothetical protein AAF404_10735, partial [Pseudomonadota bacterium]
MESSVPRTLRAIPLAAILFLSSCGGGGGEDADNNGGQQAADPPQSLETTPTETLKSNAASQAGGSVDTALDAAAQVSGQSNILASVQPDFSKLWNAQTTDFITKSLALNDSDSTTRDGNRITIDPDQATLCADPALNVDANQADRERCQTLLADLRLQIDPVNANEGTVTYLFKGEPVLLIGYADGSSSMEIRLQGIRSLLDEEATLNPGGNRNGPYTEFTGAIKQTVTTTNSNP